MLDHISPFDGSGSWKQWAHELKGKLLITSMTGRSDRESVTASELLQLINMIERDGGAEAAVKAEEFTEREVAVNVLLSHLHAGWAKGPAKEIARGHELDESGVSAWLRLQRRYGPLEGEPLVDVSTFKWAGSPEAAWRQYTAKVSAAHGQLPERLLEKWAIEGVGKLGLTNLQEMLRLRAPQPWKR